MGRADLPIDTVKRLTCDGSLVTVVEDDHGTPLDVGRKQRTVSTPLKRALYVARSRLHVPGLPAQALSSTRITSSTGPNGGETSLDNLTLLCTHHHRLLHEGGFRIAREADGDASLPACRRALDSALRLSRSRTSLMTTFAPSTKIPPRRCANPPP